MGVFYCISLIIVEHHFIYILIVYPKDIAIQIFLLNFNNGLLFQL